MLPHSVNEYMPFHDGVIKICSEKVLKFQTLVACQKMALTNNDNPDQTASEEAVWSGSSLFATLTSIL